MFRSPAQRAQKKKRKKRAKFFLNFFRFWLPFLFFSSLLVSLFTKKRKFFSLQKRRLKISILFRLLRAPLNTHAHKRPSSSWYVLRRRREKRRRCDCCCSLYSFRFCCVHLSLSLSLLSRVIEDFLTNRERESTDFFFDSFFPVNF